MSVYKNINTNDTLKRKLISALPFATNFKSDEIENLVKYSQFLHVKKGTILRNGHSGRNELMLIASGRVRIVLMSNEGKDITIRVLGKNDIICNLADYTIFTDARYTTEIDTDADLLRIELSEQILENHFTEIVDFIMAEFRAYFDELSNSLLHTLSTNLETRVARFLLKEAKTDKRKQLHFTHAQIANYLNTSREQISRVLGQFADDFLIELGYGKLTITDEEGLRKYLTDY